LQFLLVVAVLLFGRFFCELFGLFLDLPSQANFARVCLLEFLAQNCCLLFGLLRRLLLYGLKILAVLFFHVLPQRGFGFCKPLPLLVANSSLHFEELFTGNGTSAPRTAFIGHGIHGMLLWLIALPLHKD